MIDEDFLSEALSWKPWKVAEEFRCEYFQRSDWHERHPEEPMPEEDEEFMFYLEQAQLAEYIFEYLEMDDHHIDMFSEDAQLFIMKYQMGIV